MLELIGGLLAFAIFLVIVLTPFYCLIRGIIELFKAIKDKENRKKRVKNGILFVLMFVGFIIGFIVFYISLANSIVASM